VRFFRKPLSGIDGTRFEEIKYRRKVIAKPELPQKKKAEEKHLNAPILHYKKNGQK
jgi:hypothetical protein